jgi:hypothetical protein
MAPQLDVNQTLQLSAVSGSADGTTRDVTSESQWRSFDTAVATISGTGQLKAGSPGKTAVQAVYSGRIASAEVLVLTSGTFVLQGSILEAGNLPLAGARVEILDGPQAGRTVQMPLNRNTYEVYGLSGDVRVRASKEGYFAETKTAAMTANRRLDFELRPTSPPTSLAGNYRLTVTASSSCATRLRADLRARSYDAVVRQEGPRVTVTLLGTQFAVGPNTRGNTFSGTVQAGSASFSIGLANAGFYYYSYYYYYYAHTFDIVEQVFQPGWSPSQPGTSYLTIGGTVNGPVTPSGLAASLNGSIIQWQAQQGFYTSQLRNRTGDCRAPDHQFVLTRQ